MGAGSGPPRGARQMYHGADELILQVSVPDGDILPIKERSQHTYPLSGFLPHLIDVRLPGESFIYGYTPVTSSIDQLDWFPEEC
jgi:hypothetical protein